MLLVRCLTIFLSCWLMCSCALAPVPVPDSETLKPGQGFVTLAHGTSVFERSWVSEGPPDKVVLILHGSGSHSGGLAHLAEYLAAESAAVYAFDYPGFGYTPGNRAVSPPFNQLQQYLNDYLKLVRQRHPGRAIFIVGESMGGTLAIYADVHGGLDVDGVVLCGAAFDYPPMTNVFLRGLARFIGWFGDGIPLVPVKAGAFTRSEEAIERFNNDPLMVKGRIPVGHVNVLMKTIGELKPLLYRVEVPFYIQHGSNDQVAPLSAVEELYRVSGSKVKKMTIYPDVLHAILHEREWRQVANDMSIWMTQLADKTDEETAAVMKEGRTE